MKILLFIFLLLLSLAGFVYPQEKTIDSVESNRPAYNINNYSEYTLPNFELYHSLYFTNKKIPRNDDSNSVWLWTSFALSSQNSGSYLTGEGSSHMLANYHDMYIENCKFNMIRTVLGMAQVGAVGYLAYQHIKKYGLK